MAIQYRVTASHLNVRARPDTAGRILGVLNKGDIVTEADDPDNGYWRKVRRSDGLEGFASQKYLLAIGAVEPGDRFPWMPIARGEVGVSRFVGAADNPRIAEFLKSTTLDAPFAKQDETPWCSGFVNWCVEKAGIAGTDSAVARSWLNWGKKTDDPVEGCVVVYKRSQGRGHVGFFISQSGSKIQTLGGNQSDAVTIAPQSKSDLLGFRVPR